MYSLDVCTHHVRLWRFSWSIEDVRGKDCVEKFVEHVEDEVKRLYETFPQHPMTELTHVLKTEHEAAEKNLLSRV